MSANSQSIARHVPPILLAMTALFFWTYVSAEPYKLAAIAFGVATAGLNLFLTKGPRPLSPTADALRWGFNLVVVDAALVLALRPSAPALIVCWTVLVLSAQAEMLPHGERLRTAVVGTGLATGIALVRGLNPAMPMDELLLVVFGMLAIVVMARRDTSSQVAAPASV